MKFSKLVCVFVIVILMISLTGCKKSIIEDTVLPVADANVTITE